MALVEIDVGADARQPTSSGGEVGAAVRQRAPHGPGAHPLRSQYLRKGGQPHVARAQLLPQKT